MEKFIKNNIALSNEVFESELKICKLYNNDIFKEKLNTNEIDFFSKIGKSFTKNGNQYCFEKIEGIPIETKTLNNDDLKNIVKSIKDFHKKYENGNFHLIDFKSGWEYVSIFNKLGNLKQVNKSFNYLGKNIVTLHNDLVDGNILMTKNKKINLIDFEYSGRGNELFDVISFLTERVLDIKQKKYFISNYFEGKKIDIKEFKSLLIFSIVFWASWSLYKYENTNNKIYLEIFEWKKTELKKWKKFFRFKRKI